MIKFSGFADEAGKDIETQIKATKELGWSGIDLRFINGVNATDVDDATFEDAAQKLFDSGISVPCFGSAVANGKDPLISADVEYCFSALERAIPRMKKLGTKYVRGMACVYHPELSRAENEKLVFPVMKKIVSYCEKYDVVYLCENCGGYATSFYDSIPKLKKEINSESFGFVYDIGNTIGAKNIFADGSYEEQQPLKYYDIIKEYVDYVHVKDQVLGIDGKPVRTYPGEGDAEVVKILTDLIRSGYDGNIAIEPHMSKTYDEYVEYGRRITRIIENIRKI